MPVIVVIGAVDHDRTDADARGNALFASVGLCRYLIEPSTVLSVNPSDLLFYDALVPFGMQQNHRLASFVEVEAFPPDP